MQYPHVIPPKGFIPIDRNGFRPFPVAVAGQVTLETIEAISQGYEGWIRLIGLTSSDFLNSGFVIERGGAPLRDYTLIKTNIGSTDTPRECFIEMVPGQDIVLKAEVAAGGIGLRWTLFGWKYPVTR